MNPYATSEPTIHSTTDLLASYTPAPLWKRADYIKYFAKKMKWSERGMVFQLAHLKLRDIQYLKSDCDAAEREGRCAWSAAFRTAMGIRKADRVIPSSMNST